MSRGLPEITIANPCSESWDGMDGNAKLRFCESCGKSVHNLAEMTSRDVERLAMRAAMGDPICARVSHRDGELVTLADVRPARASFAAGAALSAALAASIPLAAQTSKPPTDTAVLTATVVDAHGDPGFASSSMIFLKNEGATRFAMVRADGTFEVHAPPGTYEISMTGLEFAEHAVVLHEGFQSMGKVVAEPKTISSVSGGLIARVRPMYRVRHPLAYARYLGQRFRTGFNS